MGSLESKGARNFVNRCLFRFVKYFPKCLRMTLLRDGGRKIAIKVLSPDLFRPLSCSILHKKSVSVLNVEGAPGHEAVNINQCIMMRSRPPALAPVAARQPPAGEGAGPSAHHGPGRRDREGLTGCRWGSEAGKLQSHLGKPLPGPFAWTNTAACQAAVAMALGPRQGARQPPWGWRVLRSGAGSGGRRSQLWAWGACSSWGGHERIRSVPSSR